MTKAISVFGIGKLGFPIIACFAARGYKVIGYDINPDTIQSVNERKPKLNEPGLVDLLAQPGDLSATGDCQYAVVNSDITFMVVPTPSLEDGSFSTKYAEEAARQIGQGIKNKDTYHLVVLTSTVLPGNTEERLQTILEETSGGKCGEDFGLCYSPEFIALGSVIRDFLNPDVILIGEYDTRSGDILEDVYKVVCDNDPPITRMSIRNAELAKISLNSYVTMKISFANALSELCEKIPGGDSEAISKMLGFDTRIGKRNLSGALAYGGPCFPRDNRAFAFFAASVGKEAFLAKATDKVNQRQNDRIVEMVTEKVGPVAGKKIAVLGLTYKPNTDVVEESAAVKISQALMGKGAAVSVYDPMGMNNARKALGEQGIDYAESAVDCIKDAELCLLATPWPEFSSLGPDDFVSEMKRPILIDCWRFYDADTYGKDIEYATIGQNTGGAND